MDKIKDDTVLFKCINCNFEERIPVESVYFFDIFNPEDVDSPPCAGCKVCLGTMIPAEPSYSF